MRLPALPVDPKYRSRQPHLQQRALSPTKQEAVPTDLVVTTQTLPENPLPSPSPTVGIPDSHYIAISGHVQAYPLSCEASAAVDWAAFFGVNIFEYDFQTALPLSDNPDLGYCGDVYTDAWGQIPPYAYGVHARPVADLLIKYGLPAQAVRGWSLEQVKQKLAENMPILVWVIGNMEYSQPVVYTDKQGLDVLVAPYEHAVILTGYDRTTVRYMNNGRFFDVPTEVFLTSWGVLNNMGIVYEMPKIGKKAILGDVRVGNEAVIGRESGGLHGDLE